MTAMTVLLILVGITGVVIFDFILYRQTLLNFKGIFVSILVIAIWIIGVMFWVSATNS